MTDQPPPGESQLPTSGPPYGGHEPPPPPPPPGGGSYPAPPPSSGGYAPPPPGPAIRALPTESYTPWVTRMLAFLIDYIPAAVVVGIGVLIQTLTTHPSCVDESVGYETRPVCVSSGPSSIGMLAYWLAVLVSLAYVIWN